MLSLAVVINEQGESERAAMIFPEVIDMYIAAYGRVDHWEIANARSLFGVCLTRLERFEEAESQLLQAQPIFTDAGVTRRARSNADRLARLYEAWGRGAERDRWRAVADARESADGEEE